MPVAAIGAGLGLSAIGSIAGASAAGNIAEAQSSAAQQQQALAIKAAAPTAQELQQIQDRLSMQSRYQAVQESALARDTQILSSLDPALITAGQQANNLMQGQSAAILAPMKQQQQFERNQLQQRLAAQMGPGYMTTSAGQSALQSFDMQANLQLQQAQMQSLQGITQFMGFGTSARTQLLGEERLGFATGSQMSADTLRGMGSIQQRQVEAIRGTSGAVIGSSGAQYAGQAAFGSAIGGLGQSLAGIGGTAWGAQLGGLNRQMNQTQMNPGELSAGTMAGYGALTTKSNPNAAVNDWASL